MELSDAGRASHAAPAREAAVLGVALAEAAEAEAEEEAAAKETEVAARRRRPQREAAAADSQVQDLSARLAAARAEVADGRETPRGGGAGAAATSMMQVVSAGVSRFGSSGFSGFST